MAITKNYTTDQGVVCQNAYIVVNNISYNKFTPIVPDVVFPTASASASIYFSQSTRQSNQKPLTTVQFTFSPDVNKTMISEAYAALKELPEMAGAVDC